MAKAAKNGKLHRIEQMKEMLRAGLDRADILKELIKTYKVSIPTMDNELKVAREAIKTEQVAKETILQANLSEQLNTEINAAIKSDLELDLILSQIATAGVEVEEYVKGKVVIRSITPMEQITAIDKLFKRRGSYAPLKQAATTVAGEDTKTELSDSQLEKLLHAITKPD